MSITHVLSATTPDDPGYEIQPQHWNSAHAQEITIVGNTLGAPTITGTNIVFSAGPNVTLSVNGGSLVWSGGAGAAGNTGYLSAGTTYASLGTVSFSNLNGVSFGVDGQTITASHNALTTAMASNRGSDFVQANAVFHGTSASGTIASNAISVSIGPYITTAMLSNAATISNVRISAGTTSNLLSALTFSNVNGISFGLDASTITASHNALTSQSNQAFSADGGSSAFQTLNFRNANGISFSNSDGSVQASYTVPTVPAQFTGGFSTNGNTAGDTGLVTGRVVLAGAANITLSGSTNGGSMTISISGGAGGAGNTGFISADGQTASLGTVEFSNANGVSFGINGQTVTASHNGLTSQSNQNVTAGNGGFAFQTLSFSNANGFSFGTSAGSAITGSYTVPAAQTGLSGIEVSNTTYTSGTVTFRNANGISFGSSGANGISASYTVPTQTNVAFSADASSTFQTLTFQNSNNVSFSNNAGAIRITHNLAGTSTGFAGANISGSITHNSSGINLSLSVAAPGAAAENNNINLLGANTAGNTTASGSTIGWSGINVTLSGTNNSVVNISAPATSSIVGTSGISVSTNGSTISIQPTTESGWNPYADFEKQAGQYGQATLQFDPMRANGPVQFDRVLLPIINTNSSNSSGSHTLSFWVGIYTRNASTLSRLISASGSTAITHSGTAGSYSLFSGNRIFTIPMTTTLSGGDYWLGFVSRTTSGGTNGSYSNLIMSNIASNFLGHFGSSHNTTYQLTLGQGVYTVTTAGMPASVGFSEIRGSDSQARRAAFVMFASSTV